MEKPEFRFSASLRIMDSPDLHGIIEDKTGIYPSHSHKIGDVQYVKTGKKWNNNIWILESGLPDTNDLSNHLKSLWDKIAPNEEFFQKLVDENRKIDIFCGYSSECGHAGFSIKPDAFQIFFALKIPLEISCIIL